ncbi:hypothetical protein RDWZM_009733 [Blomia tropicalis]|uniref:PPM-type phosphatase domain-containing protein n=1 Tax=Blomia tropicalis TaxID=40697 RepID=A0A9Q0RMK0_BLOTA|nr:hypothetical protein RDWZM_009733 [Blomia tropicalis]
MGAILDTPHTEKTTENGNGNDLRYGVCSMQGWRVEMEDAHCAQVGLPDLNDWNFFAVFDGHAGACVSAHCAKNLLKTILQTERFYQYALESQTIDGGTVECDDKSLTNTTCQTTTTTSTTMVMNSNGTANDSIESTTIKHEDLSKCSTSLLNIKEKIRDGFLQLDEKIKALPEVVSGDDISGSTAVCALISPTHFFFANCGDSRGVLSRNGQTIFSTQDHKPINPTEKERIQRAGGSVMIQRVNGSLAVSRALGDFQYKKATNRKATEQLVSPEPEVTVFKRDENDEFLVLACDGIWDVMTNEEVSDFVRHQLRIHSNLETICSSIIDTCLHKGSTDNMSVVLVTFKGAPKVCEEAQRKDVELNVFLENEVNRILRTNVECQSSIYMLMQSLKDSSFQNLPPGGGLDAKRSIIEEVYKKFTATENGRSGNDEANNSLESKDLGIN